MSDGGRHNVNNIDGIYKSINGREVSNTHVGSDSLRRVLILVIKPDQQIFIYLFDAVHMNFSKMACT